MFCKLHFGLGVHKGTGTRPGEISFRRHKVGSIVGCCLVAVMLAAGVTVCATRAQAQGTYTWSGDASGTWIRPTITWNGGSGNNTYWDVTNGPLNNAAFNTASLNATVNGSVYTNGITFQQAGSLSGGTINLAGTTPTITTNANASVSSVFVGSNGLLKTGNGTLSLTNFNTYTGATIVSGGRLQLGPAPDPAGILANSVLWVDPSGLTPGSYSTINNLGTGGSNFTDSAGGVTVGSGINGHNAFLFTAATP